jgi:hypothetical protein
MVVAILEKEQSETPSAIRRTAALEITFKEQTDVMSDPRSYGIAGVSIPREAFVNRTAGPSYLLNQDWTVKVWSPDVDAPISKIGVIVIHTELTPGKALKEEIWIPASAVKSIKELGETTFVE